MNVGFSNAYIISEMNDTSGMLVYFWALCTSYSFVMHPIVCRLCCFGYSARHVDKVRFIGLVSIKWVGWGLWWNG